MLCELSTFLLRKHREGSCTGRVIVLFCFYVPREFKYAWKKKAVLVISSAKVLNFQALCYRNCKAQSYWSGVLTSTPFSLSYFNPDPDQQPCTTNEPNNCVTRSYPVQLHEPTAQTGETAYRQLIYGPHACLPPHCRGETGLRLLRRGSLCSHSRLLFKLDERRCSVLPSRGPHANFVLGLSRSVLPFLLSVCVCAYIRFSLLRSPTQCTHRSAWT